MHLVNCVATTLRRDAVAVLGARPRWQPPATRVMGAHARNNRGLCGDERNSAVSVTLLKNGGPPTCDVAIESQNQQMGTRKICGVRLVSLYHRFPGGTRVLDRRFTSWELQAVGRDQHSTGDQLTLTTVALRQRASSPESLQCAEEVAHLTVACGSYREQGGRYDQPKPPVAVARARHR